MSGWYAGDFAKCIYDLSEVPEGFEANAPNECSKIVEVLAPRKGTTWIVEKVEVRYRAEEGADIVYLGLRGQPSDAIYNSRYFRKVLPAAVEIGVRQYEKVPA